MVYLVIRCCFNFCFVEDCCYKMTRANQIRNSNSVSRTIIRENESSLGSISNPKLQNSTIVIPLPLASLNEDPTKSGVRRDNTSNRAFLLTSLPSTPLSLSPRPDIIPVTNNINTANRPSTSTPRVINVDPIESREIRTISNQIENRPLQPNTLSSTSFNVNYRQQLQQAHNKHYNQMQSRIKELKKKYPKTLNINPL